MAKITVEISDDILGNLLVSAVEGGSNYWAKFREYNTGYDGNDNWNPKNCYVEVAEREPESMANKFVDATIDTMARGLQTLADLTVDGKMHGRHIANVVGDNWDAETADVVLQLALFGRVIYG